MSSIAPANSQSSYLPPEIDFPKDESLFREILTQRERLTASILNVKENAQYEQVELLSGQQYFGGPTASIFSKKRYVYRKVINFGALPNAGTKSIPHGIVFDQNSILTNLYGAASNPTGLTYISLGHASTTLINSVELNLDSTNINIITGIDRTAFTVCYIVIEWLKA